MKRVRYWFEYPLNKSTSQESLQDRKIFKPIRVPWSRRDGLKGIREITYTMQPGEELLLYKRNIPDYNNFDDPGDFGLSIGLADKIIQEDYIDNNLSALPSFLFGLFLVVALFNLYFFFVVRERVYLYFFFGHFF